MVVHLDRLSDGRAGEAGTTSLVGVASERLSGAAQ
jgi:hypothetical protein